VLSKLGVSHPPAVWRYAGDGHETYTVAWDFDQASRRGGPLGWQLRWTVRVFRKDWPLQPDTTQTEQLNALLATLEDHRIESTVILPPYHPAMIRAGGALFADMHRRFVRYLRGMQRTHRFRLVDLTTAQLPVSGYADGVHMSERNMRLMLDMALAKRPHAL
jgi:hypothetical protein